MEDSSSSDHQINEPNIGSVSVDDCSVDLETSKEQTSSDNNIASPSENLSNTVEQSATTTDDLHSTVNLLTRPTLSVPHNSPLVQPPARRKHRKSSRKSPSKSARAESDIPLTPPVPPSRPSRSPDPIVIVGRSSSTSDLISSNHGYSTEQPSPCSIGGIAIEHNPNVSLSPAESRSIPGSPRSDIDSNYASPYHRTLLNSNSKNSENQLTWCQRYFTGPEAVVRRRKFCSRFKTCLKSFLAHLFSTAGLCSLTLAYSIAGAFLIALFDNDPGRVNSVLGKVENERQLIATKFWSIIEDSLILRQDNITSDAVELLKGYETFLLKTIKEDSYDQTYKSVNESGFTEWPFPEALLFSVTVITTIGYGNKVPKTWSGRLFTMIYALFGIPIMLLCVSNLGNLMANTFRFSYRKICCCCIDDDIGQPKICLVEGLEFESARQTLSTYPGSGVGSGLPGQSMVHRSSHCDQESKSHLRSSPRPNARSITAYAAASAVNAIGEPITLTTTRGSTGTASMVIVNSGRGWSGSSNKSVPIWLVLTIVFTYICLGGYLFFLLEPNSFENMFVGAYFCFITLSTIGFGDIVPGKFTEIEFNGSELDSAQYELIVCCCYLFFGLALIAMSFNLVQESIRAKFKRFAAKIGVINESRKT